MTNAKQLLVLLILSTIAVIGTHYLATALQWLAYAHQDALHMLRQIFSANDLGSILSALIALLLIPGLITLVIAGIYWCFKRSLIPHLWVYIWGSWIILATLLISRG